MGLPIDPVNSPLQEGADGSVRVGGTRVLLDTVVAAFRNGASAEQIVGQYPALHLADVYAVIAVYLKNADVIDAYLDRRRQDAARLRQEIEGRFDPQGIRDRLLARRPLAG